MAYGIFSRDWALAATTENRWKAPGFPYTKTFEADRVVVERVAAIAKSRGVPRAQVALAWVLQKQEVTAPIIGASKLEHLDDAVASLSLKLTADEIAGLEEPYGPHPIAG